MLQTKKNKLHLILIVIFLTGLCVRLFLAFRAYDQIVFDSRVYSNFAEDLLQGKLASDCCAKNVGYGAFLAVIYSIFGIENIAAVRLVHIVLDMSTGLLLYALAKRMFDGEVAILAYFLYNLNPFTSAVTGLLLTESLSIFLATVVGYIISLPNFSKSRKLWFLTSFTMGIMLFVRHSLYYFSIIILIVLGISLISRSRKIAYFFIATIGFILASSYTLYANYKTYNKLSLVPPYNFKYEILYLNFYRWRYPEVVFTGEQPMYKEVVGGYWDTPLTEKAKHSEKYKHLLFARLPGEWPTFLTNIGWNLIWLWDKDHIYTYVDPFYPADTWIVRLVNSILIALFGFGILRYIAMRSIFLVQHPLFIYTFILFCYITFLFPLLSNESRHSLLYYPFLCLWAGHGIQKISRFKTLHI